MRIRFYNPTSGRFLNTDPSRQEMNPYMYTSGNPVNFLDPSGLCWAHPDSSSIEAEICLDAWADWYGPVSTAASGPWSTMSYDAFKAQWNRFHQLPPSNDPTSLLLAGTAVWTPGIPDEALVLLVIACGALAIPPAVSIAYNFDLAEIQLSSSTSGSVALPAPVWPEGYNVPDNLWRDLTTLAGFTAAAEFIGSTYGRFDRNTPLGLVVFAMRTTDIPANSPALLPTIPPFENTGAEPIVVSPGSIAIGIRRTQNTGRAGYIFIYEIGGTPIGIAWNPYRGSQDGRGTDLYCHFHVVTSKRGASSTIEFMRELLSFQAYQDEIVNGDTHIDC